MLLVSGVRAHYRSEHPRTGRLVLADRTFCFCYEIGAAALPDVKCAGKSEREWYRFKPAIEIAGWLADACVFAVEFRLADGRVVCVRANRGQLGG